MILRAENKDCMDVMKEYPDKYFDLAIVDPPYGGANNDDWENKPTSKYGGRFKKYRIERTGGSWSKKYQKNNNIKHWDIAPDESYFKELFRISNNQLIFGGNYFALPANRHFLIWKKLTISESFTMSMCEYIWSSLNLNSKIFECAPQDKLRFHPTQKPIALYEWIYKNYAKPEFKIIDTHLGSGSNLIAADNFGIQEFVCCEIDKEYFDAAMNRYKEYKRQLKLF